LYIPKNKAQLNAIKQVLKAMKISFEKEEKAYNPEFVAKIKESDQNYKDGKFKTIKVEDLWK